MSSPELLDLPWDDVLPQHQRTGLSCHDTFEEEEILEWVTTMVVPEAAYDATKLCSETSSSLACITSALCNGKFSHCQGSNAAAQRACYACQA